MNFAHEMTRTASGFNQLRSHPEGTTGAAWMAAEAAVTGGRRFVGYSNDSIVTSPLPSPIPGMGMGGYGGARRHCGSCKDSSSDDQTMFVSLDAPSQCGSSARAVKRFVRYSDNPPSPGVTESLRDHSDGSFTVTYYPGSLGYKPDQTPATTSSAGNSNPPSARSACSGGSCARSPAVPVRPPVVPVRPPIVPVHPPVVPVAAPISKKSTGPKDVAILIFGTNAMATSVSAALVAGAYNNFSGVDRPLVEDLNLDIQYTDDIDELRTFIRSTSKCDIIITYGTDVNKIIPVCHETGYDGSLLLIGGATAGVLDADKSIPSTVTSVITTHGFGDGAAIVSKEDHAAMTGTNSWVYVNDHDSLASPASLIDLRRVNRDHPHPYLLELVRALKFSHSGLDWKNVLETKLYWDNRNVVNDHWV